MRSVRAACGTGAGLRILAGLCLWGAATAWPHDDLKQVATPITFEALDSNRVDQRISRTEAGRYRRLSDHFAVADRNGDGFVDRVELEDWLQSLTPAPHRSAQGQAARSERPHGT